VRSELQSSELQSSELQSGERSAGEHPAVSYVPAIGRAILRVIAFKIRVPSSKG
jgi:hypothetical protein